VLRRSGDRTAFRFWSTQGKAAHRQGRTVLEYLQSLGEAGAESEAPLTDTERTKLLGSCIFAIAPSQQIDGTQNRDARAIHLKLDEIIRAIRPADNNMIDIEKLSDEELQVLAAQFEKIRAHREPQEKTKSLRSANRGSHA
jgi:hypothetical protein